MAMINEDGLHSARPIYEDRLSIICMSRTNIQEPCQIEIACIPDSGESRFWQDLP